MLYKEIYRPTYAETNLKFSNLLKEETKFLKNLTNLEKFNFENDFKVNGRRVKDCKVVFAAFIKYCILCVKNFQIQPYLAAYQSCGQ